MLPFQDATRTPASDWRHIVRFGRNVASYKFALGRVLLDLKLGARQQTFVPLPDLAVPYAAAICEHLAGGVLGRPRLARRLMRGSGGILVGFGVALAAER